MSVAMPQATATAGKKKQRFSQEPAQEWVRWQTVHKEVMMRRPLLLAGVLCTLAGCQSMKLDGAKSLAEKMPWSSKEPEVQESPYPAPVRIVAIWSDAVYTEVGRAPVRGVGGRLYFYDPANETVPVEGQLVVYGYDDSDQTGPAQNPARKFIFTPEQFNQHYAPTDLGASYSIWLPWDEAGGFKKSISLLPVFTASSGGVIMGTQSTSVLPGKSAEEPAATKKGYFTGADAGTVSAVQAAGYDAPTGRGNWQTVQPAGAEEKLSGSQRLRTATIPLPMATTRRLIAEQAAVGAASGEAADPARAASNRDAWPAPPQMGDSAPVAPAAGVAPAPAAEETRSPLTTASLRPAQFGHQPQPTRFERPRYQVQGASSSLPGRGHAASPPVPSGPLPGLPSAH